MHWLMLHSNPVDVLIRFLQMLDVFQYLVHRVRRHVSSADPGNVAEDRSVVARAVQGGPDLLRPDSADRETDVPVDHDDLFRAAADPADVLDGEGSEEPHFHEPDLLSSLAPLVDHDPRRSRDRPRREEKRVGSLGPVLLDYPVRAPVELSELPVRLLHEIDSLAQIL